MGTVEDFLSFVDTKGVAEWCGRLSPGPAYAGFPRALQEILGKQPFRPEDVQPLSKGDFKKLRNAAVKYANASVARFSKYSGIKTGWAEHGPYHFLETADNLALVVRAHCVALNLPADLIEAIVQIAWIAGYTHDCHHMGSTLLMHTMVPKNKWQKYQGKIPTVDTPLEWVSALAAMEFGLKEGLSPLKVLLIVALILSSIYGGADVERLGLPLRNIPIVKPTHPMSMMMRISDALPHSNPRKALARAFCVKVVEQPVEGKIETAVALIDSQRGFYTYVSGLIKDLRQATRFNLVPEWETRLASLLRSLEGPDLRRAAEEMFQNPQMAIQLRNS
jgi:hypothetical protein